MKLIRGQLVSDSLFKLRQYGFNLRYIKLSIFGINATVLAVSCRCRRCRRRDHWHDNRMQWP